MIWNNKLISNEYIIFNLSISKPHINAFEVFKVLIHMQNDSSFTDFEKEMFVECDETCVLFVANIS